MRRRRSDGSRTRLRRSCVACLISAADERGAPIASPCAEPRSPVLVQPIPVEQPVGHPAIRPEPCDVVPEPTAKAGRECRSAAARAGRRPRCQEAVAVYGQGYCKVPTSSNADCERQNPGAARVPASARRTYSRRCRYLRSRAHTGAQRSNCSIFGQLRSERPAPAGDGAEHEVERQQ